MEKNKKTTGVLKVSSVGFQNGGRNTERVPKKAFSLKVRAEFRTPKTRDPTTFHASSALKGLNSTIWYTVRHTHLTTGPPGVF